MLLVGHDVVLLAPIGPVAVNNQPQALEGVDRPVHGRRSDLRIHGTTPLEELRRRDVAGRRLEGVEDGPSLRRPAKAAGVELAPDGLRLER